MNLDIAKNISAIASGQRPGSFAPYKEAHVLLLYWKDANDAFYKQLHNLGLKFKSLYGYDVEEWPISSEEPYRKLNRKLFQFLEYDKEDTLLIVYYGGHGTINQDRHHIWLCHDPAVDVDNPSINWSSLQQLFLNDCKSHVLFLLDCCRAAASVQDSAGSSVVELIAAAGFESVTPLRGQHTFTSNLMSTLDDCRGLPVRTPDLMRKLTARLKHYWPPEACNEKRVTPGHFIISNNDQATYIVIGKLREACIFPGQGEPLSNLPTPLRIPNQEIQVVSLSAAPKAETLQLQNPMLVATADCHDTESSSTPQTTLHVDPESRKHLARRLPRAGLASRVKPGIATGVEMLPSRKNTCEYAPIDQDHIRLIHLLPGNISDPLICTVSTRRLRDVEDSNEPEYQAISHVWDDTPRQRKLQVVDRGEIYIGYHTHTALCQLRDESGITTFWIDDLCIDLHNPEEKRIQLSMLATIFYNAWHVCIWLGDNADGSDKLNSFIPRLLDLSQIDKLVECDSKPEEWQAFAALMMRPWFNRRWIIQELILASEATLYCGSEFAIAWPDFCDAVALFGSRFDEIRRLFKKSPLFDYNPENLVDIRTLSAFSLVEASRNIFLQSTSGEASRTSGLETLVSYLSAQQASDPRDTIYALLPLASDCSPSPFQVDYNKSCLQVFKEFIDFCVRESKSIDIICRPWAPESMQLSIRNSGILAHPGIGGFLNQELAPSWLSKISNLPFGKRGKNHYGRINGDSLVGHPNRKFYNASKGTPGMVLFGEAERKDSEPPLLDGSMTVSGVHIGKIESLGPRAADGTILADWIQMGEWKEGDTFVPDHFWRTLVADRGPNGIPPPAWYHRACLYCLEQSGGGDITLAQLSLGNCPSMAIEFLLRVRNVIWNRRFLRTSDNRGEGLFGLAPPKAREGDFICVLLGCSVPVVLRRHKRFAGAWELIGECFVYGMMEGEAMNTEEEYPSSTEEFELR